MWWTPVLVNTLRYLDSFCSGDILIFCVFAVEIIQHGQVVVNWSFSLRSQNNFLFRNCEYDFPFPVEWQLLSFQTCARKFDSAAFSDPAGFPGFLGFLFFQCLPFSHHLSTSFVRFPLHCRQKVKVYESKRGKHFEVINWINWTL